MHVCLGAPEQHDGDEAPHCKAAPGPRKVVAERERNDSYHGRRLEHLGLPRTRKGEIEFNRRCMGRDFADSSAGLGSNVGPDGGLKRWLRLHTNKKELTNRRQCGVLPGTEASNLAKKLFEQGKWIRQWRLERLGRLLSDNVARAESRADFGPCTRCRITCSRRQSCPEGAHRKRSLNIPRRKTKGDAGGRDSSTRTKKKRQSACRSKSARMPHKPRRGAIKDTLEKHKGLRNTSRLRP